MDEDIAARMVAVLCASIMAAAAGEKDHVRVLATSDIYLDFIRPRSLHVSSDGAVSFEPDEGGVMADAAKARRGSRARAAA